MIIPIYTIITNIQDILGISIILDAEYQKEFHARTEINRIFFPKT